MFKKFAQPQFLLPAVLSIALFGTLLGIADASRVAGLVGRISPPLVAAIFPLVLAYLVLKSLQLRFFLGDIGIRVRWRALLLAFATGEVSVSVPGGMFLGNYVLSRLAGAGFARSSAATAAMLIAEAGVALTSLAVLDVPGWGTLRPSVLVLLAAVAIGSGVLMTVSRPRELLARTIQVGRLRPVGRGIVEMAGDLRRLLAPRVVTRSLVIASAYLLVISAGLFVIAHGIGEPAFTYRQAVTVYLFGLAMALLTPIQFGVIEVGGLGVLQTMGYAPTEALGMLLSLRLVWTASTWLICGSTMVLLRGEWNGAARGIPESDPVPAWVNMVESP